MRERQTQKSLLSRDGGHGAGGVRKGKPDQKIATQRDIDVSNRTPPGAWEEDRREKSWGPSASRSG